MMRRLLHLTKVADTLGSLGIHMSRVNRRNSTDFGYPRRLKIEPIIRSDLYRRSLELHISKRTVFGCGNVVQLL